MNLEGRGKSTRTMSQVNCRERSPPGQPQTQEGQEEAQPELRERPERGGAACMHAEVKESAGEVVPRSQHKRKGDLAGQRIEFQDSVQGWREPTARASQRSG